MEKDEFYLVDASDADIGILRELDELAYRPYITQLVGGWDPSYFPKMFRASDYQVVRRGHDIVGFVCVKEDVTSVFIRDVVLRPDFQNRGFGSKIIKTIIDGARIKNKKVTLKVFKGNRAIKLYERLGFYTNSEDETSFSMLLDPLSS